jgi:hypothetical protein
MEELAALLKGTPTSIKPGIIQLQISEAFDSPKYIIYLCFIE